MQLSKTTQYAIRALSYLHVNNKTKHSVNTLHKELDIPYKYLTKLMTDLVGKGLVVATRGRDGGFSLAKDADSIYLSDIIDATGESLQTNQCVMGFEKCDFSNPCSLHERWLEPKSIIDKIFTTTTLNSLVEDKNTKI